MEPIERGRYTGLDFLPAGDSPAELRRAEQRELEELRAERVTHLGRIDALQGEIGGMKRERVENYERGKRDGARLRGLPSILTG